MKTYQNFDTGEIWTEDEIRKEYEAEESLLEQYPTFENYMEHMLSQGRAKTGGIVEIERFYAVQETPDDPWDYGSYDFAEAIRMLREQGDGLIAVIEQDAIETFCVDVIYADEIED